MVLCIGEILADLIGGTAQNGAVVYPPRGRRAL